MSKRVMLVEDEPNIIEAVRFILSRDGWDVSVHSDGASAVEAVTRAAPDVVILDAMLPGKTGYDILRDLRAAEGTADLPVLMLTAKGQPKDRALAESLGASAFMTKPFSNAAVIECLRGLGGAGEAAEQTPQSAGLND
ncbi:response regulator [Alphaproteobacteria bacterium KMM 3653]|uniref:Response regulator n=1 Tax=Harenicola maris TaxID=2841044 RepID=A0AAP2G577_9RHOB|nr:response regulator [Harenicola maris]